MNVSEPFAKNNHLSSWVISEASHLGIKITSHTLETLFEAGTYHELIRNVDEEYFSTVGSQNDTFQHIFRNAENFIYKECGKKIKLSLRNKILIQSSVSTLFKLLIFCSLHCKKREEYISRVMHLEQKVQTTIMQVVQEINSQLFNVLDQQDVLSRIQELEQQNQFLKTELAVTQNREQNAKKAIVQLEEEVEKNVQEIKKYKDEKQKAIQFLQLQSFQEYLLSFQRLQQQNRILARYVQELQESNNELESHQKQMKNDIQKQSVVIVDLNDHVTDLKQKITILKLQNSTSMRCSIQQHQDVTRSFGTELNVHEKQNILNSKKGRVRNIPNVQQVQSSGDEQMGKAVCLDEEMKQLRKYNSQLICKLDTVYKSMNNLTVEASQMKQQKQNLRKENRFYRKQILNLRKLHERMEKDLLCGRI